MNVFPGRNTSCILENPEASTDKITQSILDELPVLRLKADKAVGLLASIIDSSDDAIIGKTLEGVITHTKADDGHVFELDTSTPKWHGWYSLQKGVATSLAGLSDSLAAKGLLRHSSVSTTERHYIKDVPENTLRAMKLLESMCNPRATDDEANQTNCLKRLG